MSNEPAQPTIFLSYAHDDRVTAQRLAAALARRGYTVWWDRLIEGGASSDSPDRGKGAIQSTPCSAGQNRRRARCGNNCDASGVEPTMPGKDTKADRREQQVREVEESQTALRKSIKESERLVGESDRMLRRHRKEREKDERPE